MNNIKLPCPFIVQPATTCGQPWIAASFGPRPLEREMNFVWSGKW